MNWDAIDWHALERLRAAFLSGTAGASDYWQSESDLASYDTTFAQRIGWKWDCVLAELGRRGWSPPQGTLLDWGCGSGVAGRVFLDFFGRHAVTELRLSDRSPLAVSFAARRARQKYPKLKVHTGLVGQAATLLLSHVLTELTQPQIEELLNLAGQATAVLWVEPGNYEVSCALVAIRERLRAHFNVVAPCTHQARCGLLAPENARHWCHHFAAPPPEVFRNGNWARFAKLAGVDLRSLPLSFLVLDKRSAPPLPPGAVCVLGRPRVYKPHALLLGCDAAGVRERKLTRRAWPEEFKRLKKGEGDALQVWRCEGEEILGAESLFRIPDVAPE